MLGVVAGEDGLVNVINANPGKVDEINNKHDVNVVRSPSPENGDEEIITMETHQDNHEEKFQKGQFFNGLETLVVEDILDTRENNVRIIV